VAALKEGVKPVVSPNSRALPPDEPTDARKAALLGLGLDGDGQVRITRGENFLLLGGSQTTHEEMQDTAVRFNTELEKRGKRLDDIDSDEFFEITDKLGLKPPDHQ